MRFTNVEGYDPKKIVFVASSRLPPMFRHWNAEGCPSHFLEEIIA
jgi:hypothetical protein